VLQKNVSVGHRMRFPKAREAWRLRGRDGWIAAALRASQ
jgi:hypothetical protein